MSHGFSAVETGPGPGTVAPSAVLLQLSHGFSAAETTTAAMMGTAHFSTLQLSHGFSAVETGQLGERALLGVRASIEPRLLGRGDVEAWENASVEAWELQLSHGFSAVETRFATMNSGRK